MEEDNIIRLKIGGDGSDVARSRNVTAFCMSVLNLAMEDFRKDSNVHTLLLLNCSESYARLASSLEPLCKRMKEVQEGGIVLDGKLFHIEFWLAADYKFLCLVLGHQGARALFNCIFCVANRDEWKQTLQLVWQLSAMIFLNFRVNFFGFADQPLVPLRLLCVLKMVLMSPDAIYPISLASFRSNVSFVMSCISSSGCLTCCSVV